MERDAGIWVLAGAAIMFAVVVVVIRPRVPGGVTDGLVALCGGSLAAGALLVQQGVGVAEWFVTLPVTAGLAVANIRSLFAASGPLRI
jgi:hypothetical protein